MQNCFAGAIVCLFFLIKPVAAQTNLSGWLPVEGNWAVSWRDVQGAETPNELFVSISRDRITVCELGHMNGCRFDKQAEAEINLEYRLSDGNYFVQRIETDATGSQLQILHAYGLHGHWGGEENLSTTDPNIMSGLWRYKEAEGRSDWRRIEPDIFHVAARNPPNLGHMRVVETISDTHLKLVFDPTMPGWSKDQDFPHMRPHIIIRVEGNNLWGFQTATLQNPIGIEVSDPQFGRNPTGVEYLDIGVTFWPGARAGRYILDVSGTAVVLDLEFDAGDISGQVSMDVGQSSNWRPMGSSPADNPLLSQHDIVASVLDIGDRRFTEVEAVLTAEAPIVLLAGTDCLNLGPQTVICAKSESEGQFDFDLSYAVQPISGANVIETNIKIRAVARDPISNAWVNAGRATRPVYIRNCEATFQEGLAHVAAPDELRTIAQRILTPVDALPGTRLFPGPENDSDAGENLTRRAAILTNTLASNKGLDAWLFAQSRAEPSVFEQFADIVQNAKTYEQCSQVDMLTDEVSDARDFLAELRANRTETQGMYLAVLGMMAFNEEIVAQRLNGYSGLLPKALQTVLSVGGSPNAPSSDSGLINRLVFEFSQGVVGWVPGEFVSLTTAILEETAALMPGSASSSALFKAPGVLSLIMSSAQIGVSAVDLELLLQLSNRADNIKAWMEAGAYVHGLLTRYDALDIAFSTSLRDLESVTQSCTCQY
jgi:hypothetical protein